MGNPATIQLIACFVISDSTQNRSWICCQIGAREHYAIPRAVNRKKLLECLITDYWSGPGAVVSKLPDGASRQLKSRSHPELANENICSFNAGFLKLELESRIRREDSWETIKRRNDWFQQNAADKVSATIGYASAPFVFSYSYGAKQIFQAAMQHDCTTILGQIDPGPFEWRLVSEVHQKHGLRPLQMPPESYWDDWRTECDLADLIIVNSPWARTALIGEEIPADKIRVIPLAYEVPLDVVVEPKQLPDQFSQERPMEVLYLGLVIGRKGIVELADAIERLGDRPVCWTIVGSGDAQLLEQLARFANVKVTGQVDRQTAVQHYQQSDVFILPTHSDGFGLTLLEAAAFGLPIIASPFCGEVVHNGVNGLVIPEVTAEAIVESVALLIDDPAMVQKFHDHQLGHEFRTIDDLAEDLMEIGE